MGVTPKDHSQQPLVELLPSLKILTAQLHDEIDRGAAELSMEQRGLAISFRQAKLFPPEA